jgi:site-specific DNA recombinase
MKIRYIPFGYRLLAGSLIAHKTEADLVRTIFKKYLAGESYSQIAAALEASGVPYNEGASRWNKSMVGRILQNCKYTGKDGYPSLVTENEFKQSALLQQEKYTRKDIHTVPEIATLKEKLVCGECGTPYERLLDRRHKERWKCKNAGCLTKVKITDANLSAQVISLLNWIMQKPQEIKIPTAEAEPHNLEITRLSNEINRELDKPDCNEDYARTLIMARAALQYAQYPDALLPEKTRKIKERLESSTPISELDSELLLQTVDTVIIRPEGAVSLKLINGQIIQNTEERSKLPCKQQNA